MKPAAPQHNPIQKLVRCLASLPGIGEKTATRLALFLVTCPKEDALDLARSIHTVRETIRLCRQCFNYAEAEYCSMCAGGARDGARICVVETPADILSIEKAWGFGGTYHVLHGVIAPLDGIGPEQLRIKELVERVRTRCVDEIILATNPTMSGNATAVFIADTLRPFGITITRLAQGIPPGADIGYADQLTLKNALEGRRVMQ